MLSLAYTIDISKLQQCRKFCRCFQTKREVTSPVLTFQMRAEFVVHLFYVNWSWSFVLLHFFDSSVESQAFPRILGFPEASVVRQKKTKFRGRRSVVFNRL